MEHTTYVARIMEDDGNGAGLRTSRIISKRSADTQADAEKWARSNMGQGQYAEILLDRPERKYGRYRTLAIVRA